MDKIVNAYGLKKIDKINGMPFMRQIIKTKTVEIIRRIMSLYDDGRITLDDAMRGIANAEGSAAKILYQQSV